MLGKMERKILASLMAASMCLTCMPVGMGQVRAQESAVEVEEETEQADGVDQTPAEVQDPLAEAGIIVEETEVEATEEAELPDVEEPEISEDAESAEAMDMEEAETPEDVKASVVVEAEILESEETSEEVEIIEEVSGYNSDSDIVEELELDVSYPYIGYLGKTLIFKPKEAGLYYIEQDASSVASNLWIDIFCVDGSDVDKKGGKAFFAEKGKTYKFIWSDRTGNNSEGTWKISKIQRKDIELGKKYTSQYEDLTYYTFTPEQPGIYKVIRYDNDAIGAVAEKRVLDDRWVYYNLYDEVLLEGGKEYAIYFFKWASHANITWEMRKIEDYIEVKEGVEYQDKLDLLYKYLYEVEDEGVYRLNLKKVADNNVLFDGFINDYGSNNGYDFVSSVSDYSQYYTTLKKGRYNLNFRNYSDSEENDICVTWKIEKVPDKELKLDRKETLSEGDVARYTYSPTETGLYQLTFGKGVNFRIVGDDPMFSSYPCLYDKVSRCYVYYLTEGIKYSIYVDNSEKEGNECNILLEKFPLKKIEADVIYPKDENESVYYQFQAKTSGKYLVKGTIKSKDLYYLDPYKVTVYDRIKNEYLLTLDKNEEIILLVGEGEKEVCISSVKSIDEMEYAVRSNGTVEITGYQGEKKDVVIPDKIGGKKVTAIKPYALQGVGLTSVQLPSTLKEIGAYAFSNNLLTEVVIPDSVTDIGGEAFAYCGSLKKVVIGSGVKVIPYGMFRSCTSLTELIFPKNSTVREIQYAAFINCDSLSTVAFPDTIEKCGNGVFGYNESSDSPWYKKQPEGAIYIGQALYKYKGVAPAGTKVTVKPGTVSISSGAFYGQTGVSEVILPDGLKEIGAQAFSGTQLKEIVLPDSLVRVEESAFSDCTSLTKVTLSDDLKEIGERAFSGTRIQEIAIPDSVTDVGRGAFSDCVSLKKVTFGSGIKVISSKMFESCRSLEEVVFPKNGTVREIQYDAFMDCTTLSEIDFPDTIEKCDQKIFGYYEESNSKWYKNQPDGVIYIGHVVYKYKGDAPEGTKITLKPGTASITDEAFYGKAGVSEVVLPYGIKEIGQYAFVGANSMESIVIPATVTKIGEQAIGYVLNTEMNVNFRRGPGYDKKEGFIIYGEKGSEAEKYALRWDFKFIEKATCMRGDVDLSGKVDISDLRLMLRHVCGKVTLTGDQITAGDIAGQSNIDEQDGLITIADLRKLLRFICGKIEVL